MSSTTDLPALPERPDDGHKGTFGTVIVVGGCMTMPGAAALTATAALRTGVGLVKIASDPRALPWTLSHQPSATGVPLAEDADERTVTAVLDEVDPRQRAVLAVGPGMGQEPGRLAWVRACLAGPRAVVLDADALNLLAANIKPADTPIAAPCVVTPHPGEYRRLAEALGIDADPTDPAQRPEAAAALARTMGVVVLLKGRNTLISDGDRTAINATGNPALATAGSGDVLTGIIAALIAQGLSAFDAARLGAHLHGRAADLWAAGHGRAGMLAMELAHLLPDVMQQHRQEADQAGT